MAQFYLIDREFGRIVITLRSGMRRLVFKWKGGTLHISAPTYADMKSIESNIDACRTEIRKIKPCVVSQYHHGQEIGLYGNGKVYINHVENQQAAIRGRYKDGNIMIDVRVDDFSLATREISDMIVHFLRYAAQVLIPLAQRVAKELDVSVNRFTIGRGFRRLGCCNTKKNEISLSCMLMVYPEHIIRYVICHELAHISYADHSRAFHELVDKYCGGKESALEKECRNFKNPIIKI